MRGSSEMENTEFMALDATQLGRSGGGERRDDKEQLFGRAQYLKRTCVHLEKAAA